MVLYVVLLLGLLELIPQSLYPVMVTRRHLTARKGKKKGNEIFRLINALVRVGFASMLLQVILRFSNLLDHINGAKDF